MVLEDSMVASGDKGKHESSIGVTAASFAAVVNDSDSILARLTKLEGSVGALQRSVGALQHSVGTLQRSSHTMRDTLNKCVLRQASVVDGRLAQQ